MVRHMEKKHAVLLQQWLDCKNTNGNFKNVYDAAAKEYQRTAALLEKNRQIGTRYFKKLSDGLTDQVLSHLLLTMWSVVNGVSRIALNDPIFDRYHVRLGICQFNNLFYS